MTLQNAPGISDLRFRMNYPVKKISHPQKNYHLGHFSMMTSLRSLRSVAPIAFPYASLPDESWEL